MKRSLYTLSLLAISTFAAPEASAQLYQPPHSLPWPLQTPDGQLRNRILQQGLGDPRYGSAQSTEPAHMVHSGLDIYGAAHDPVLAVMSGDIVRSFNVNTMSNNDCRLDGTCRLFVMGDDDHLYYYSHICLNETCEGEDGGPPLVTSRVRSAIENARLESEANGSSRIFGGNLDPCGSGPEPTEADPCRETLGGISAADSHLHLAMLDASANFDVVNPLTALKQSAPRDNAPPTVGEIQLVDASSQELITPTVEYSCAEVVSGSVDIVSFLEDRYTDTVRSADPSNLGYHPRWDVNLNGFPVYQASATVRAIRSSGAGITDRTFNWYTFDRLPIECTGSVKGLSALFMGSRCRTPSDSSPSTLEAILQLARDETNRGSLIVGRNAGALWLHAPGPMNRAAILTNEHALNGAWQTDFFASGLYEVSVTARDEAGNQSKNARLFTIGTDINTLATPDIFIRDHSEDDGSIPSNFGRSGFQASWVSPDIMVVPGGSPRPDIEDGVTPPQNIDEGGDYDIYLRVFNRGCASVNMRVSIWSSDIESSPTGWITPIVTNEWAVPGQPYALPITVPSSRLVDYGDGLQRVNGVTLVGPFPWTPSRSHQGFVGLGASIDADSDPISHTDVNTYSATINDNNIATFAMGVLEVTPERVFPVDVSDLVVLYNPTDTPKDVEVRFGCNNFPVDSSRIRTVELITERDPRIEARWANVPGIERTVESDRIRHRYTRCDVNHPVISLAAQEQIRGGFYMSSTESDVPAASVDISVWFDDEPRGGLSFGLMPTRDPMAPPACLSLGQACVDDFACCNGSCGADGKCEDGPSCVPENGDCTQTSDCCDYDCLGAGICGKLW